MYNSGYNTIPSQPSINAEAYYTGETTQSYQDSRTNNVTLPNYAKQQYQNPQPQFDPRQSIPLYNTSAPEQDYYRNNQQSAMQHQQVQQQPQQQQQFIPVEPLPAQSIIQDTPSRQTSAQYQYPLQQPYNVSSTQYPSHPPTTSPTISDKTQNYNPADQQSLINRVSSPESYGLQHQQINQSVPSQPMTSQSYNQMPLTVPQSSGYIQSNTTFSPQPQHSFQDSNQVTSSQQVLPEETQRQIQILQQQLQQQQQQQLSNQSVTNVQNHQQWPQAPSNMNNSSFPIAPQHIPISTVNNPVANVMKEESLIEL